MTLLERSVERLRQAMPEASPPELRRLARSSMARTRALRAAEQKALRLDRRRLCRLLRWEGWEHLHAARDAGGGAILLLPPLGARALARQGLAIYLPELEEPTQDPAETLRRGGILALDFDLPAPGELEIPFLGRREAADPAVARLAARAGAAILPILCLPFTAGRFLLAFRPLIPPQPDPHTSTATLAAWLEAQILHHPDLWPWSLP